VCGIAGGGAPKNIISKKKKEVGGKKKVIKKKVQKAHHPQKLKRGHRTCIENLTIMPVGKRSRGNIPNKLQLKTSQE